MAHGGRGIGRHEGQVVFVEAGVPGDVVEAVFIQQKKRFATAEVTRVENPSPDRVVAPCPVFGKCGGCDWQMMSIDAQRRWKRQTVVEQLTHLGGVGDPPVSDTVAVGPAFGYRNRIDLRIHRSRPALYARRSHVPVPIEDCPLGNPPISDMIARLRPDSEVDRVTLRASEKTGDVAALHRRQGRWERGMIREVVAGHRFRITGRAFFQVNTQGAEALVAAVGEFLEVGPADTFLDGYSGGGLFSATVGSRAARTIAVESDRVAVGDLAVNAPNAEVIPTEFESARPGPVDVAVVDPPRTGLGADGVAALVATRPRVIAYVACDPAALGRDTGLLVAGGYTLDQVIPIDMFPQTHHIEAVARFSA